LPATGFAGRQGVQGTGLQKPREDGRRGGVFTEIRDLLRFNGDIGFDTVFDPVLATKRQQRK
jgi:hypothetical protein